MWKMYSAALGERARYYHLHEPQLWPLAFLLKIRHCCIVIYDIHEHLPEMILDFSTRPRVLAALVAAVFSLLDGLLVRWVDATVVVSDLLVSRFGHLGRRVVAIYNYPRIDLFDCDRPPPPNLRRKYGAHRVALYHGQIARARGMPVLVRASMITAQRIDNLKVVLLGPVFGDAYRAELMTVMRNEGASGLVELLDPVPHEEVPHYISVSEVGLVVLPPFSVFRDSLPIKLFEYMACQVPVVGSRLPAIQRVIEETRCGLLVDPTDAKDIGGAIAHLLEHPEEARAMGQRGKKAVGEKYNWSRMEIRLLDLYRDLEEAPC
jgi:glycosyltransferase involved in cell wall biosynthesis